MAIQEEISALLRSALEPQSAVPTPEMNAEVEAAVTSDVMPAEPSTVERPISENAPRDNAPDPVQVAGMGKVIGGIVENVSHKFKKRVAEAEKRVLPKLGDEPVQTVGGNLIVREATKDEVDRLSTFFPKDFTKGLNIPAIASAAGDADLADFIQQIKNANKDMFEKAKRGKISWKEMVEKAKASNVDSTIRDWLSYQPGKDGTAEDTIAGMIAGISWTSQTKDLSDAVKTMADGPEKDKALLRLGKMFSVQSALFSNIQASIAEAARKMRAAGIMQETLGGQSISAAAEELKSLKLFDATTPQDFAYINRLYSRLPSMRQKSKFLQYGNKWAKIADRGGRIIVEAFINSILSSPVTHSVNIGGNAFYMSLRNLETQIAGNIVAPVRLKLFGGDKSDRVFAREAMAERVGIYEGLNDALTLAFQAFIKEEGSDLASKLDITEKAIGNTGDLVEIAKQIKEGNGLAALANIIGVSYRLLGSRLLITEDEFFKALGTRMSINKQAYIISMNAYDAAIEAGKSVKEATEMSVIEKQRILDDPPDIVMKNAAEAAKEMVFQKDLTGFMKRVQDSTNNPLLKIHVPFVKTPTNILNAFIQRLPVFSLAHPEIYRGLMAGGREADIAITKIGVGATIVGGFATMSAMGGEGKNWIINGHGPTDKKVRNAWLRRGFLPYSISFKMPDGTYKSVTYNRFDPISGMLGVSSDTAYYVQHEGKGIGGPGVANDIFIGAAGSVFKVALTNPFLQGVSEIKNVLNVATSDPVKGAALATKLFSEKGTLALLSLAPTVSSASATVARYIDPTKRSTMLPSEGILGGETNRMPEWQKGFYTALQRAQARNPLFNKNLPPALNVWGEERQQGNGSVWEMISPIKIKNTEFRTVDEELQRLKVGIPEFPKKINGVELTGEQYNRWVKVANYGHFAPDGVKMPKQPGYDKTKTLMYSLLETVSSLQYKSLSASDEDRANHIIGLVAKYRKNAKKYLLMDKTVNGPDLKSMIDAKD